MPTGLQRFQQSGQFHFLTFSCYRRQPLLASPAAKNTLEHTLEETRAQQALLLVAYVLMPEHVHLLTDEPEQETIATFLQLFKQQSSTAPGMTQFWQCRYYDRNVPHPQRIHQHHQLHPPQPGKARPSRRARALPLEQRPMLCDRNPGHRRPSPHMSPA